MKAIFQDKHGPTGNCLTAAVASIFNKELKEVPHFIDINEDNIEDKDWWNNLEKYCKLRLSCFPFWTRRQPYKNGYYITVVKYLDGGVSHAIVSYNGKYIHNPAHKQPRIEQPHIFRYNIGFGKL